MHSTARAAYQMRTKQGGRSGSGWIQIRIRIRLDPDSDPVGSGFESGWIQIRVRLDPDSDPVGSGFGSGWIQIRVRLDPDQALGKKNSDPTLGDKTGSETDPGEKKKWTRIRPSKKKPGSD